MCTSFVFRKSDILIGMNFDNNGMAYSINVKKPEQFVAMVDGGRGKWPSFGVRQDGTFINNLCVNSNGKGQYRRPGKNVTHTSKLVADVLDGAIQSEAIGEHLKTVEVVNTPDYSTHNMLVLKDGGVYVVEPGRGVLYSPRAESPFFVMTNFSLLDARESGVIAGDGAQRYHAVTEYLKGRENLSVDEAFAALDLAKQAEGAWKTAFSMVYVGSERAVYYCYDMAWGKREKHVF